MSNKIKFLKLQEQALITRYLSYVTQYITYQLVNKKKSEFRIKFVLRKEKKDLKK